MTDQTSTDETVTTTAEATTAEATTAEAARLAAMPPQPTTAAAIDWIIEHTDANDLTEATRVLNAARRSGAIELTGNGLLTAGCWRGTGEGVQP